MLTATFDDSGHPRQPLSGLLTPSFFTSYVVFYLPASKAPQ